MNIETEQDCVGIDRNHDLAPFFDVLTYKDGLHSFIPKNFFQDWLGQPYDVGTMHLGKCSGFGIESIVKYDSAIQSLQVGRFVSGGLRVKFLLNGQHEIKTMSTSMLMFHHSGLMNPPQPQYGNSIIKNDIWIGDEVMMLGGGVIEDGCVIGARSLLPPNFKSEPFGIYAGTPARLIRFRFTDKIIESLLEIEWWAQPDLLNWLKVINPYFLTDFTVDEIKTLDLLAELKSIKANWVKVHQPK